MNSSVNTDSYLLADEKFDFDVSLSPASSKGDEEEDEVFVGPVGQKERCVLVRVEDGSRSSWSPLTGDQLEAMCQEAHQLAGQLQRGEPCWPRGEEANTTAAAGRDDAGEEFVQDAEAKLGVLGRPANTLTPIKRQTFCVQDSPMKQLPDAIQRRLLKGNGANAGLPARSASARLGSSSPVGGAKPQPRTSLRGKSGLGASAVLPNKPSALARNSLSRKMRETDTKKSRLQQPIRVSGASRLSPAARLSSRTASCEDLLSDSASVASDASDSSLNSSSLGRRALAPPTKSITRNLSAIKALPPQTRRVTDRRNTSSSSSSVSSFNSSLSVSPAAKVKLNSSLNVSVSCRAPPSVSRPSNTSIGTAKSRRSSIYSTTADPPGGAAGRRCSLSAQSRKPSEDRTKPTRSTPLKRAETALLHPIPGKRATERTASIPGSALAPSSALKAKAHSLLTASPSGQSRVCSRTEVVSSPDVSRILKPNRLMSAGSVDGLPQHSERPPTPSAGGNRMVQLRTTRPSALPTPLRRRTSAISTATPSSLARPARAPPSLHCDPAPTSAQTERGRSPAPSEQEEEESVHLPRIQPFCLEGEKWEEPLSALPSTSPQLGQSESLESGMLSQEEAEPKRNLVEVKSTEEVTEVLLLGLPRPSLQPQEKLLIDLSNTPDLIRTNKTDKTCSAAQLIDLSSPLIKWSPDDKKENKVNEAPLINLSF